jgi:tripartite-type tricarboxylate transporter receptor subunit TctC
MRNAPYCGAVFGALVLAGLAPAAGHAQSAAEFYAGRNVTLYIGSGAGGGYDVYARALARHMGRHIPGKPNIVSQNMPGAASLKLTEYLYNVAAKDGSAFGAVYNTIPIQPLVRDRKPRFDPLGLSWVGSMGKHQNICVAWHTTPFTSFEQVKRRQMVVAATGATGNAVIYPTVFNQMLGTKFKVVGGYQAAEARLAVERGEAEGICGMSYQTLVASHPQWFEQKRVRVLAQIGLHPHPALKGAPMALDMVKKPADRELLEFMMIPQEMGRPFVAPPEVPADRLAALRQAFAATMTDPAFLAEAKQLKLQIEPMDHAEMATLVKRLYAMPKDVIRDARKLMTKKGGGKKKN